MAFLKRLILIFAVLLGSVTTGVSQDYEKLQEAFKYSYSAEAQGDYTAAIEQLRNVYQHDSYELNLRLGWLTYMSGMFTESVAYYSNAINIQPMSVEARLGIVYPESAVGNWGHIVGHYRKILEIDPMNSVANYRLGSIYYGRQEYETAHRYFEKLVNLYPFDYDALLMYGWTNLKMGKLREAKVLFNKVLLNKPADKSALEGLSQIR